MRAFTLVLALSVAAVLLSGPPVAAQEGHPLKGSWLGTWAAEQDSRQRRALVLNWDGKNITGTINPGTDNMAIKNATLNPEGWVVHLEADAKDKAGDALTYVIDGKIENLPLPNRIDHRHVEEPARRAASSRSAGSRRARDDIPPRRRSRRRSRDLLLAAAPLAAHHEILAKFDDKKPVTLSGVVTLVDWRNPHVHVFMNVRDAKGQMLNWAIELESPIDLQQSGWTSDSLQPGDAITVEGIAAQKRQPSGLGASRSC